MTTNTTCQNLLAGEIDDPAPLYDYAPDKTAAIIFFIVFGLTSLVHIGQAIKFKTGWLWPVIFGALWETVAYIFRILSITKDPTSKSYFIPMTLLLLLAPLWLNAFIYMTMGRVVHYFLPGEKIIGLRASRLTLLFVGLDVTAFIVQVIGAVASTSSNASTSKTGFDIYTAGVALQQAFLIFFTYLVIVFHRRVIQPNRATVRTKSWKPTLFVLYLSIILLSIRIIYRIVNYASGTCSYIQQHEAFFYCLDSLPIFVAWVSWNFVHPGTVLKGLEAKFPKKNKKGMSDKEAALEMGNASFEMQNREQEAAPTQGYQYQR
ncbi:hypothetical protein MMC25_000591 [Agyrium rufum]|nr:hypothetical protein [Agyrium rufum]